MLKRIWRALLSLTFRAIFAALLFAGVNWLVWTYTDSKAFFDGADDPVNKIRMCYAVSGICVLIGALGTFRRGSVEQNFSIVELARIAGGGAGALFSSAAVFSRGERKMQVRSLRRFPVF